MLNKPSCYYGDMFGRDKYVRKRYQKYLEFFKPYLKPQVKVLDVGGYRGELKTFLPSQVKYEEIFEYVKIDLSEATKRSKI